MPAKGIIVRRSFEAFPPFSEECRDSWDAGFTFSDLLLYVGLILEEHCCSVRRRNPARTKIEQQLHFPRLKNSPFGSAVNQFFNKDVKRAHQGRFNTVASHSIEEWDTIDKNLSVDCENAETCSW
jgi:hypothetical protein